MSKFFQELRRRSVFSVATTYVVAAWLLMQVADLLLPIYNAPEWILPAFTTVLILGFPVAVLLAWAYDLTPMGVRRTETLAREAEIAQQAALALPPGPSIAVLPFKDLSGQSDQALFAEAMTNAIMTGLTQSSSLRVVSSGTVPDGVPNLAELGTDLGVRYLLQGSVNKSAEQLRVTAQLTDTTTSEQLWSDSYDKQLSTANIFGVQDDIREQIVATLGDFHGVIFSSETQKNVHRPTENLNAFECLSVALAYDKYLTQDYHLRARESLERAVKIDPKFDQAWAHLSWIYTDEVIFGYNPLPNSMERALQAAKRAVELAPNSYHDHWLLSRVYYFSGDKDLFFAESQKALGLNSNDGTTLGLIGAYTAVAGEWSHGVALIEKAQVLNPRHPDYYYLFLSAADFHKGDFTAALALLSKMTFIEWPLALLFLMAANALTDNVAEASRYREMLDKILPGATLEDAAEHFRKWFPYADDLKATLMRGLEEVMPASFGTSPSVRSRTSSRT